MAIGHSPAMKLSPIPGGQHYPASFSFDPGRNLSFLDPEPIGLVDIKASQRE